MLIYKITNKINGKCYIGQTIGKLTDRWKGHKYDLRHKRSKNQYLQNAWDKYGEEAFYIEELVRADSLEQLNQLEIDLIAQFNSLVLGGYNLRVGGLSGGAHSQETRKKLSERGKGNTNGKGGKGVSRHSEAWKAQLAGNMRNYVGTPEAIKACGLANRRPIIGIKGDHLWFFSGAVEAEKHGFKKKQISKVLRKQRNTHKGYSWFYISDYFNLEKRI